MRSLGSSSIDRYTCQSIGVVPGSPPGTATLLEKQFIGGLFLSSVEISATDKLDADRTSDSLQASLTA
ncbi:unnamed protein product [Zymoseptoria tritici ST99CH_3D7]|uniref:Uncharacterized protein n=1 Tax=Zymoseptoria tritici (strain ST99CH_3D7) TaxID=1276538 RepID=A0A1X7RCA7_ZYMT9|nr:unnamed protein product [Zymoseptoria tritici ST99CH_3D7]